MAIFIVRDQPKMVDSNYTMNLVNSFSCLNSNVCTYHLDERFVNRPTVCDCLKGANPEASKAADRLHGLQGPLVTSFPCSHLFHQAH